MRQISELIVRMAQENPRWGYTRIQGALANLHHRVGRRTIATVLKRGGMEPSPERGKRTPWQAATDCESGALRAKQYLIIDRDSKYSERFRGCSEKAARQ
jgi:putative transposase